MKLPGCRGVAPFVLASTVAARSAILYAPHDSADSSISAELSPSAAALVLLQRSGLSQSYSLQGADQQTLDAINTFGVPSPSVFYNDERASKPSFTIVIDGVQDPETFVDRSISRHIKIANPPSSESTTQFLQDLSSEDPSVAADRRCDQRKPNALLDCLRDSLDFAELHGHRHTLYHTSSLQAIAKEAGAASERYRNEASTLALQLTKLIGGSSSLFDLTVLLTPLAEPSKGFFSRSTESKWISRRSTLSRRQDLDLESGHPDVTPEDKNLNQNIPETPEAGAENLNPSPQVDDTNADADPAPVAPPPVLPVDQNVGIAQSSNPPRGILPLCYASADACEKTTNNCSGHGECTRKYTVEEGRSCFSCTCKVDREDGGNGVVRKTVWAGPACQKRDVSVPFWLLFGATIGLVGAVTWALSLLYSMGSEELPGVLSAGVGGPSARGK